MVEAGLFEDERIELLRGALIEMSPQDVPHANCVERLNEILMPKLVGRARVRIQLPLALSEDSEPEPDVAVVAMSEPRTGHPRTALLILEVADSSLAKDRRLKADLYATAGIPEYWIANLVDGLVMVHRDPVHGQYTNITSHRTGATVAMSAFADVTIAVGDILGG